MTYIPENIQPWTAADPAFGGSGNYCGADLTDFYVAPVSVGRDTSDSVALSNWRVITAELEKLAQHEDSGIHRFGHWAVGWYELFLIHRTDSTALECADQWAAALADYPVANEHDLSEQEMEAEQESWDSWGRAEWRDAVEKRLAFYAPAGADRWWAGEVLENVEDAALDECWADIAQHLNWVCEHHSEGPCFNFDGAADSLSCSDLAALTGLPLLHPDQQWRTEPYPWADGSADPLVKPLPVEL